MARPRTYDDALRARLIETAAELLAAEGPRGVSVRRVAAACDTSTTAIYALLGNKGELVRSIYLEGFRRLGDRLAAADAPDPLDRLAAQRDAYLANALANPHLYAVMFGPSPAGFEPDDEDTAFALSTLRQLIDCVQACIDADLLDGDADDIALELWASSHGVCMLALAGMFDADEAHRHLVRLQDHLFVGLTAQRGALSGGA